MSKEPEGHSKKQLKSDTQAMQRQVEELTLALQRERADALNQSRRHEQQLVSLRSTVKVSVISELLPVIDNFERALKHVPSALESNEYVKGVEGIVKQFEKTLESMGVVRVETVGKAFDPRYHEAVSMEEGSGKQEIVSEELQAGYRLGDDVIRHAMVKVKLR
jgi:molecular chaperone GrpE